MIRWGLAWLFACACIFAMLGLQHAKIEAQAKGVAWCADTLQLEQDVAATCISTLTECQNFLEQPEPDMTHEEALIAMTKLWLEAEAKLKNSISLDELEKLRVELIALAPSALQGPVDEFFQKAKHR